jgi:hypothetical protein
MKRMVLLLRAQRTAAIKPTEKSQPSKVAGASGAALDRTHVTSQKGILPNRGASDSELDPNFISADSLKKMGAQGIQERIKAGYRALRSRFHRESRAEIARLYAYAMFLMIDEGEWLEFIRLPAWENFKGRPKPADQADAFRHVLRMAIGFRDRRATKFVNKWNTRVAPLMKAQIPVSRAASLIIENKLPATKGAPSKTVKQEFATIRIPLKSGGRVILDRSVGENITLFVQVTKKSGNALQATVLKSFIPTMKTRAAVSL